MSLDLLLAVAVLLVLLLPAPPACDRVRGDILPVSLWVLWVGLVEKAKRGGES